MVEKKKTTFKPGKIEITIDTKGMEKFLAAFERVKTRIAELFVEWLQSEEGQKALKEAIQKELK